MSELYKVKGKFQAFEEKEISASFTKREAVFQIDNRYGDGKGRTEDVPFAVYGKSLETAKTLQFDQECEIQFRIGANKGFVKLSAQAIIPGKVDDEIKF